MTTGNPDLAAARLTLVKIALSTASPGAAPALPPSIEIVGKRKRLGEIPPVAFLAQFNAARAPSIAPGASPPLAPPPPLAGPPPVAPPPPLAGPPPLAPPPPGPPEPDVDGVFLLKPGVNLVGHDPYLGDFQKPKSPPMESRQWLVLIAGDRAYVADHGSTNQSLVLPRSAPRLPDKDPRYEPSTTGFGPPREGMTALDAAGSTVFELSEGDVLITYRGALVFGWVSDAH